ncbi:MAG: hypothetical protein ACTSRZ_11855 [Promethearchaeota archaeon]
MRIYIEKPEWNQFYYKSRQFKKQKKIQNETLEQEKEKVEYCLSVLHKEEFLLNTDYDLDKFLGFRELVRENFFIYWTAINPPMEHLLFAISNILKPINILGIGIFTGYPIVWSMGPAILGMYSPQDKGSSNFILNAIEIDKNHAKICQENFDKICNKLQNSPKVKVHAVDGHQYLKELPNNSIDLLYLDANGKDPEAKSIFKRNRNTKRINYTLLKAAYDKIKPGGAILCHNATMKSFKREAKDYLNFTADENFFSKTASIAIDEMGLEFSKKL